MLYERIITAVTSRLQEAREFYPLGDAEGRRTRFELHQERCRLPVLPFDCQLLQPYAPLLMFAQRSMKRASDVGFLTFSRKVVALR